MAGGATALPVRSAHFATDSARALKLAGTGAVAADATAPEALTRSAPVACPAPTGHIGQLVLPITYDGQPAVLVADPEPAGWTEQTPAPATPAPQPSSQPTSQPAQARTVTAYACDGTELDTARLSSPATAGH